MLEDFRHAINSEDVDVKKTSAARRDGEVLGGATVVLAASRLAEYRDPDTAGLRMLAVDPAAQGTGAGRALVLATIELARRHGRRRVALHTQAIMKPARALYESMGFVRRPEQDIHLPSGLQLLAYELEL